MKANVIMCEVLELFSFFFARLSKTFFNNNIIFFYLQDLRVVNNLKTSATEKKNLRKLKF